MRDHKHIELMPGVMANVSSDVSEATLESLKKIALAVKNEVNDLYSIHNWFGLSYANYLVLPRSVLQSMPDSWQEEFVKLLDKIPETLEVNDIPDYRVKAVGNDGKFIRDPYNDYQRGRRVISRKVNHTNGMEDVI